MLHPYTQGTLITANARLSRHLRREYDAARRSEGQRVWESPDILPRDAWLAHLWQECVYRDPVNTAVLLGPAQEETLWEQAIAGTTGKDDPLLDVPATAAAAGRVWDLLHTWEAPLDRREFEGLPDPEAYLGWMDVVQRKLRANGWITTSQLPWALQEKVTTGALGIAGPLAHAGFDEVAPADRRLFEACGVSEAHSASVAPVRQWRVGLQNTFEELMHAAAWARRKLKESPAARIGIVVRGLAAQSHLAERIFDDVLHPGLHFDRSDARRAFHVSAGVPSSETPMIAAALLALGLVDGLSLNEAGMLLRSPFLNLGTLEGARLDAELRRHGVEEVSLRLEPMRRALPALAKAAEDLRARQRPGQWSEAFSQLLMHAGWPGKRLLSSAEYQTLEHWKKLLSELAALDLVLPRITYHEALTRLRRLTRDSRFAPSDEDAPVQIMDVLEAAGSRFDALWIAGLHAGIWPEPPRPSPFLPLSLQRAAGMPHSAPERELAYAERVTARLLASAPEVVCSWPHFAGEESLRVSPLIEDLPESADLVMPVETASRRIFASAVALERQPESGAPPVDHTGEEQRGGMKVLEDQAACPFRAFAIHRLRARELDAPELGISPRERGTVAHRALELIWSQLQSQRELLSRSPDEISGLVQASVRTALDGALSRRPKNNAMERFRALEQTRLERLVLDWLEQERKWPPFRVVESETARSVNVAGLTLRLKVDRVDQYEDGSHAILDYKTSTDLSPAKWEGERPDAPQLPLYASECGYDVSAVYFAKLVPGGAPPIGLQGSELQERLPEWKHVVEKLAADFLAGRAEVDPKNGMKTCEFCDLHSLCRISERGAVGVAEDEAGE